MSKNAPGKSHREGQTVVQSMDMFPDEAAAVAWFESTRWRDGERHCGKCGSTRTRPVPNAKPMPYWCTDCRSYFSARTGTPIAGSRRRRHGSCCIASAKPGRTKTTTGSTGRSRPTRRGWAGRARTCRWRSARRSTPMRRLRICREARHPQLRAACADAGYGRPARRAEPSLPRPDRRQRAFERRAVVAGPLAATGRAPASRASRPRGRVSDQEPVRPSS